MCIHMAMRYMLACTATDWTELLSFSSYLYNESRYCDICADLNMFVVAKVKRVCVCCENYRRSNSMQTHTHSCFACTNMNCTYYWNSSHSAIQMNENIFAWMMFDVFIDLASKRAAWIGVRWSDPISKMHVIYEDFRVLHNLNETFSFQRCYTNYKVI